MPFLLKRREVQMLCWTCYRVWDTILTKTYFRVRTFDLENKLECPWCKTVNSVLWDGLHHERITNGFAFPARGEHPKVRR
jgi:hypothetical protein